MCVCVCVYACARLFLSQLLFQIAMTIIHSHSVVSIIFFSSRQFLNSSSSWNVNMHIGIAKMNGDDVELLLEFKIEISLSLSFIPFMGFYNANKC